MLPSIIIIHNVRPLMGYEEWIFRCNSTAKSAYLWQWNKLTTLKWHTLCHRWIVFCKNKIIKKMAHRWIVFCRRKSLSGNWKTNVGQSILEEVNVFWTNSSSINKSQYFKGTNNNNRDSEIYAISKEEILGIPVLGFCLQRLNSIYCRCPSKRNTSCG